MDFGTCPHCGNETLSDDFSAIPVNGRAVHARCFPKYSELAAERGVRKAVPEILGKSVS